MLASGPGTDALTGAQCSTNTIQWTYDTYEIGHAAAHAIMQRGGKTWFFITADYTFGHDLQNQASDEIVNEGGKILGAAAHPLGANDFSSFLLQAQVSGAQVIALANAGADETNALKQAGEFALTTDHTVVGLIFGLQKRAAAGARGHSGAADRAGVVLGPQRQYPSVCQTLPSAHEQARNAKRHAGRAPIPRCCIISRQLIRLVAQPMAGR